MARDLFVASLALGDAHVLGLKRPPQAQGLYSPRLPLNAPRGVIFREPRGHIPQDKWCTLMCSQHTHSQHVLQHLHGFMFTLGRALLWQLVMPVHDLVGGCSWQQ